MYNPGPSWIFLEVWFARLNSSRTFGCSSFDRMDNTCPILFLSPKRIPLSRESHLMNWAGWKYQITPGYIFQSLNASSICLYSLSAISWVVIMVIVEGASEVVWRQPEVGMTFIFINSSMEVLKVFLHLWKESFCAKGIKKRRKKIKNQWIYIS